MSSPTESPTTAPGITPGTWTIDAGHSEVGFTVRHLGLSKVRGRFDDFSGTATIGATPEESSVEATIALASIDTNNAERDAHLRSGDFFDAEKNVKMTFVSTAVTEDTLVGDLTIGEVTKSIDLDLEFFGQATDQYGATKAGFAATGQLKRSDFGITFNAPGGLDGAVIGDTIKLELNIELTAE